MNAATAPGAGTVQSVDRALQILDALARAGAPIGVTEIARQVGLAQGTTHRLLRTLAGRGYARRAADRKYAVGVAAIHLGDASYRELTEVAEHHLPQLVELSGETANLALLEGQHMVYVAQAPSPHTLRIFAEVGRRVPVHSTAVGKAILAAMPTGRARALMDALPLDSSTPNAASTVRALATKVDEARADGFAVDDEEQEIGVRCVGVALPLVRGIHLAASVSGPSDRFSLARAREVGASLPAAVSELASALSR